MSSLILSIAMLCQVHGKPYPEIYQEKCQTGLTKCVLSRHESKNEDFLEKWDYSLLKCLAERKR